MNMNKKGATSEKIYTQYKLLCIKSYSFSAYKNSKKMKKLVSVPQLLNLATPICICECSRLFQHEIIGHHTEWRIGARST